MKTAVLITMILAVMAPVLAQGSKLKLYECFRCGQQRQAERTPFGSDGGICIDKHTGKKNPSHAWSQKN
jgi:hypothetical protein